MFFLTSKLCLLLITANTRERNSETEERKAFSELTIISDNRTDRTKERIDARTDKGQKKTANIQFRQISKHPAKYIYLVDDKSKMNDLIMQMLSWLTSAANAVIMYHGCYINYSGHTELGY